MESQLVPHLSKNIGLGNLSELAKFYTAHKIT